MKITRNTLETTRGPADWFTGDVYVDTLAAPSAPSRLGAANVHFTPGRAHRLAHPPLRPDDPRHRGRRAVPAPRRAGRGHPPRRPCLLRARGGPLARRRPDPVHGPRRHARGRRLRQPGHLGRARHGRGIRRRAGDRRLTPPAFYAPGMALHELTEIRTELFIDGGVRGADDALPGDRPRRRRVGRRLRRAPPAPSRPRPPSPLRTGRSRPGPRARPQQRAALLIGRAGAARGRPRRRRPRC